MQAGVDYLFPLIMLSAVVCGGLLLRRSQSSLSLNPEQRVAVGISAFCGAMLGAKLPFALMDWEGLLAGTTWFTDGKTIMCGMVGAYFAVEATKWTLDIKTKTGDSFAVPVAVTVAIGRLGCLRAGCCFGVETDLPWAMRCAATDDLLRHPTQIYESVFHFSMARLCYFLIVRGFWKGQIVKFYILSYLLYRFATEFLRPELKMGLELTWYQWFALLVAPVFIVLWIRDAQQAARQSTIAHESTEGEKAT
ncbi:MAG: prolipoprotein diacylglyceryl transferase family protein [Planctomycetota bacterium]